MNVTAKFQVSVSDFAITQQDIPLTKTPQDATDYAKAITMAFYNANVTEVPPNTKPAHSTYTTICEYDCDRTIGSYILVAIAHNVRNDDVFTLTSSIEAATNSERSLARPSPSHRASRSLDYPTQPYEDLEQHQFMPEDYLHRRMSG